MPQLTIGLGVLLVLLGVGAYFGSGAASVTALIPAFFGAPLAALGMIALRPAARKHAMHVAAALALLGFLGAGRGLAKLPALISGGSVERPAAVAVQSAMALLCLLFVALCVKSFIEARRRMTAGANA